MINLQLNIRNPYIDRFDNIKCWFGKTPFKHKFWELQIMKTNDIISVGIDITHRQDHAGFRINVGILGFETEFHFYDNRHWDQERGQWVEYLEENERQ